MAPTNAKPKKTGIHGFDNTTQGSLPAKKISKASRGKKSIGKRAGQILGAASTTTQTQSRPWWSDLRAEALPRVSNRSESISESGAGQEAGRHGDQQGPDMRGESHNKTRSFVNMSYTGAMSSTVDGNAEEDVEWDDPNDKDYDENDGEYEGDDAEKHPNV